MRTLTLLLLLWPLASAAAQWTTRPLSEVAVYPEFRALVQERLASNDVSVIICRRPCILQMKKLANFAKKK